MILLLGCNSDPAINNIHDEYQETQSTITNNIDKKNDQDIKKWNLKFKHDNKKFKVGINWQANLNIPGRSVPLKFFYKLSLFKNLNCSSVLPRSSYTLAKAKFKLI